MGTWEGERERKVANIMVLKNLCKVHGFFFLYISRNFKQ